MRAWVDRTDTMPDRPSGPGPQLSMARRTVLGVLAVAPAAVAGCTEERGPVVVDTSITLGAQGSDDAEQFVDGNRDNLAAGEYLWWEFSLETERVVEYQLEVVEGDTVNAYILEPEEYDTLAEDEAGFDAVSGTVSDEVTSTTNTTTLDPGTYTLVIMNAAITPENA
jgi:hypothetical protein